MFLVKSKKQPERLDSRESVGKCGDRPLSSLSPQLSAESTDTVDGLAASRPARDVETGDDITPDDLGFNPDELPDGYSISPQKMVVTQGSDENCPVRDAEVGT